MNAFHDILLADDSSNDTELTLEALSEINLANRVVAVRDGVDVLEYLRCEGRHRLRPPGNPALVLLDVKMPRLNGIDALQAIRDDPALKSIPVVMLTSSREEQDLIRSYALGVNAYVVKPVDFQQFLEAVKQIGAFWAILNEQPPYENQA